MNFASSAGCMLLTGFQMILLKTNVSIWSKLGVIALKIMLMETLPMKMSLLCLLNSGKSGLKFHVLLETLTQKSKLSLQLKLLA